MISTTRAGILQLADHQDSKPSHAARLNANTLASLPLHAGGFAHTDPETLTVYAYLSSVKTTQHDRLLGTEVFQHALRRYTDNAYDKLATLISGPITMDASIMKVLPPSAFLLARPPTPSSNPLDIETTKKIQSVIGKSVSDASRTRLRERVLPPVDTTDRPTIAAGVHILLITARSQQSHMMAGSLWYDSNLITSADCTLCAFCQITTSASPSSSSLTAPLLRPPANVTLAHGAQPAWPAMKTRWYCGLIAAI